MTDGHLKLYSKPEPHIPCVSEMASVIRGTRFTPPVSCSPLPMSPNFASTSRVNALYMQRVRFAPSVKEFTVS